MYFWVQDTILTLAKQDSVASVKVQITSILDFVSHMVLVVTIQVHQPEAIYKWIGMAVLQ